MWHQLAVLIHSFGTRKESSSTEVSSTLSRVLELLKCGHHQTWLKKKTKQMLLIVLSAVTTSRWLKVSVNLFLTSTTAFTSLSKFDFTSNEDKCNLY